MTKDLKYIIKRVIIGVLISLILMFIGSFKVHALTYTINDSSLPPYIDINGSILGSVYFSTNRFTGAGSGYLLFSFAVGSATNGNVDGITEVIAYKKNGNTSMPYVCDIGNGTWYTDNQQQRVIYSVKCPMDLNNNEYLSYIGFYRGSANGRIFVYLPNFFSYTAEVSDANNIINSNNQNIQQQIQNDNTNTQSLMNGMAYVNTTITEQGERIHNDVQQVNDTLKDESAPSDSDLDSILDNKSNNNNVSNLVMFVPNIFASVGTGLSSNCSGNIQLGNLLGTNLQLTCIRPQQYIGSQLWTIIDFMFLFGLFLAFSKWLVNIYNDLTSLKEVKFQ